MNLSRFLEATRGGCTLEAAMDAQVFWKGKDPKSTTTTNTVHKQDAQYNTLLSGSDKWLQSGGFDKNYGGSATFDPVADFTSGQTSGVAGMQQTGANLADIYNGLGGGTPIPIYNLNHKNPIPSTVAILGNPTITAEGTKISCDKYILGTNPQGGVSVVSSTLFTEAQGLETVLAPNSTYLFKSTSLETSDTQAIFSYNTWYEGGLDLP